MPVSDAIQKMIDDLTEAKADAEKHDKGQFAAGTRLRKAMQGMKTAAQDVRLTVVEERKDRS